MTKKPKKIAELSLTPITGSRSLVNVALFDAGQYAQNPFLVAQVAVA
jgi:hypothetical protein